MPTIKIGDGVAIDTGQALNISIGPRPRIGRRATNIEAPDPLIDKVLSDAEFQIASDIQLTSGKATTSGARRLTRQAAPATITVDVDDSQDAVLLIEGDGGVVYWQSPDESSVAATTRGATTLRFTLPTDLPSRPGRRRSVLGGAVIGWLFGSVRVRVLRFVAQATISLAVNHIEGHLTPGLVDMSGPPGTWKAPFRPNGPFNQPLNVLLMVHGTFSTTAGSFSHLAAVREGQAFLEGVRQHYDMVIGFDHPTLAADPEANAEALLAALSFLPNSTRIDAVAYSRGGLVLRVFTEKLAKDRFVFGKCIFVGCTNGGTVLADPKHWYDFVNRYTNALLAAARALTILTGMAMGAEVIALRTLAEFVKLLPRLAIEENRVPGLQAMMPESRCVKELDRGGGNGRDYYVIASDYEPRLDLSRGVSHELVQYLVNSVADDLLAEANDLVVHTASMAQFGPQLVLQPERIETLDRDLSVYHTIYFQTPQVAKKLYLWLILHDLTLGVIPNIGRSRVPRSINFNENLGENRDLSQPGVRTRPTRGRRSRISDEGGPMELLESLPPIEATMGVPESSPLEETTAGASVGCHFAAEIAASIALEAAAPLFVTISDSRITIVSGRGAATTITAIPVEPTEALGIEVIALKNCQVAYDGEKPDWQSSVRRDVQIPKASISYRFLVKGSVPGEAILQIEILQAGRPLTSLRLSPVFVDGSQDKLVASKSIVLTPSSDAPAIMRIFEIHQPDGTLKIRYDLACADPEIAVCQEITLAAGFDIGAFVGDFYARLEDAYALGENNYQTFVRNLADYSVDKTNGLVPEKVRKALWENRKQIKAVQVISDSPHIPWELLYIDDPTADTDDNKGFLCEWGLVRWMYNARWPDAKMQLRGDRIRYVIPDYLNDNHDLPGADREREMLVSRFRAAAEVEANSEAVRNFLKSEARGCDLLHFACHGEAQQKAVLISQLILREGEEANGETFDDTLTFETVKRHARFADDGYGMVFINACQTGRGGKGISGVAGFAEAFLRPASGKGVDAFVGALWSVDDTLALNFATEFYDRLIAGSTLAEASQAARAVCHAKGDFTWLAYSVYGNPFARLERFDREDIL